MVIKNVSKTFNSRFWFGAIALASAIWTVWIQVGGFEYIAMDDNLYTWEYPFVANGFSWANFKGVCCKLAQGGIWMPLTSLTYMLEISVFGAGPGTHHLMNVAWHSVNAILVFYFIYELTSRKSLFAAFVGAAFWAIHPQRCESVCWIADRKDMICTFFTLLGLLAWRRGVPFVAYLLMFCACCSKPTGMVFPALAFCVEKEAPYFFSRIRQSPLRTIGKYLLRYAPMIILTIATAILTTYSQTHWDGLEERELLAGYGCLPWRCLNAAVAVGLYFAQLVVPYGLYILYLAHPDAAPDGMWVGLSVLLLIVVGLVWAQIKSRSRAILWLMALWFLAAISPTLGIAGGFGCHARADRFLYLPMIGVSVLMAAGLAQIEWKRWCYAACLTVLSGYAVFAAYTSMNYQNNYTVFRRVLDFDPNHAEALRHVAVELCARFNDPDAGIAAFQRALKIDPHNEDAAGQLCYMMARRGRPEDIQTVLEMCSALMVNPGLDYNGIPTEALGIVMMRQRQWDEAIRFFSTSLKVRTRKLPPDETLAQIAICHYNKGDVAKAVEMLEGLAQSSQNEFVRNRAAQTLQTIRIRQAGKR